MEEGNRPRYEMKVSSFNAEEVDHTGPETAIPLSPQWLHAKPAADNKEVRPVSMFSQGGISEPKDQWRSEVSHDKKEWRRPSLEHEGARSWRDEERETGAGKRDRRKEVDRDTDTRKTDRKAENLSGRWQESGARDRKWTTAWGADEGREKRPDGDKDESERPSMDKWRPSRLRDQKPSKKKDVGFVVGRGRGNTLPGNNASRTPIGASVRSTTFLYPRGKLLDIYRERAFTFSVPDGFVEVPGVTALNSITPLAFISPEEDELEEFQEISKGNLQNNKDINKESAVASQVNRTSPEPDDMLPELDESDLVNLDLSSKMSMEEVQGESANASLQSFVDLEDPAIVRIHADNLDRQYNSEKANSDETIKAYMDPALEKSNFIPMGENHRSENTKLNIYDSHNESSHHGVAFDNSSFGGGAAFSDQKQVIRDGFRTGEGSEELSLYYKDPQGQIQGPFLGSDILKWLDEGYFGTELLVCLSDALEDTHFRPLAEILPFLRSKYNTPMGTTIEDLDDPAVEKILSRTNDNGKTAFRSHQSNISSYFPNNQSAEASDQTISLREKFKFDNSTTINQGKMHVVGDTGEELLEHGRMSTGETVARVNSTSLSRYSSDLGSRYYELESVPHDHSTRSSDLISRMQSLHNQEYQNAFDGNFVSANSSHYSVPGERTWEEHQMDLHPYNQDLSARLASNTFNPEKRMLDLEAEILFQRDLQQKMQNHQTLGPSQLQLPTAAKFSSDNRISSTGHYMDPSLLHSLSAVRPLHSSASQMELLEHHLANLNLQKEQQHPQLWQHGHEHSHPVQMQSQDQDFQRKLQFETQFQPDIDPYISRQSLDSSFAFGSDAMDQCLLRQGFKPEFLSQQYFASKHSINNGPHSSLEHLMDHKRHDAQNELFLSQQKLADETQVKGVWMVNESGEHVQTQVPSVENFDIYQHNQNFFNAPPPRTVKTQHAYPSNEEVSSSYFDRGSDRRSLHGPRNSGFSPFEMPMDILSGRDDSVYNKLNESKAQQNYNLMQMGFHDKHASEAFRHDSRIPSYLQDIISEISNGPWENSSLPYHLEPSLKSSAYTRQQVNPTDFSMENTEQKLHLDLMKLHLSQHSQEHIANNDWLRRALVSNKVATPEMWQSEEDLYNPKPPVPVASMTQQDFPGALNSRQNHWTSIDSFQSSNVRNYDTLDLMPNLYRNAERERSEGNVINVASQFHPSADITSLLQRIPRTENVTDLGVNDGFNVGSQKISSGLSVHPSDSRYDIPASGELVYLPYHNDQAQYDSYPLEYEEKNITQWVCDVKKKGYTQATHDSMENLLSADSAIDRQQQIRNDHDEYYNLSTIHNKMHQMSLTQRNNKGEGSDTASWSSSDLNKATGNASYLKGQLTDKDFSSEENEALPTCDGYSMATSKRQDSQFPARGSVVSKLPTLSDLKAKIQDGNNLPIDDGQARSLAVASTTSTKTLGSLQTNERMTAAKQKSTSASGTDTKSDHEKTFLSTLKNSIKAESEKDKSREDQNIPVDFDSQGQKNLKRKGKKGKQIDPSLLGFKVTSNRIMMGEIHKWDD